MNTSEFSLSALRSKLASSKEEGIPLFLSRSDIARALTAFLAGEIDENEVADWAEFYDANEAVEFESDAAIPEVLFDLSSPEINGRLDKARAREWLSRLLPPAEGSVR